MIVDICQKSLNCTLKRVNFTVWKLYFNFFKWGVVKLKFFLFCRCLPRHHPASCHQSYVFLGKMPWSRLSEHCFASGTKGQPTKKGVCGPTYLSPFVPPCLVSLLTKAILLFLNYSLLILLLQLNWFFPLCFTLPSTPHSLRQSLHHCSYPWVMSVSSLATPFPIPYFTSPWLFCNYLFLFHNSLNVLTNSPTTPSHLATIKTLTVSMILSLFFLCA